MMNVVVLAGGISTEREVSAFIRRNGVQCACRSGYKTVLVDSFLGLEELPENILIFSQDKGEVKTVRGRNSAGHRKNQGWQGRQRLWNDRENVVEVCKAVDIVYMGLDERTENGRMQAFLMCLNQIHRNGRLSLAALLRMHKGVTRQMMLQSGVMMAKGKCLYKGQGASEAAEIGFPCIVKPCCGGSSIGILWQMM